VGHLGDEDLSWSEQACKIVRAEHQRDEAAFESASSSGYLNLESKSDRFD
jgi:hypothetical protein